ncbi:hypothetical protein Bra1253DRAFT_06248 [Bradyrhizobium sp. WSM1253]|nr:hypothetical protein Bra1253DRAFT_06248 [Bradyrhizobium sp. WSM1253]
MSLLGLNQGVENGKRESKITSLALELGDDPLLLTDVLLAFVKTAFGYDQALAQARKRPLLPPLRFKAGETPRTTPNLDRVVRHRGRAQL